VDGNRHGTELVQQLRQAADVVDVRVGQKDGLHDRPALTDEVDHQPWLEVGVDDDSVVRVDVLDEVRVGAESSVGRGGDAQLQVSVFRRIRCLPASR